MWKNIPLKGYVYASFGLNLIVVAAIFGLKSFLPPVLPLFYGLATGTNQLTHTYGLLIAPATGLLITLLNICLTIITKDQFFKKTLIISAMFVSILITITVLKIILLVGFF